MAETLDYLIAEWSLLQKQIEDARKAIMPTVEKERELRAKVIAVAFPDHAEGTANLELGAGWQLKGNVKIDRKVDEAALPAVKEQLAKMGVSVERLLRFKPEVELKQYRTLTAEQLQVFDQALILKPSAPTLELVPPKE